MRRMPITNCASCGATRLRRYPYRNHQHRAFKPAVLRAYANAAVTMLTSSPRRRALSLFSPRFEIACCETCGYGRYEVALDEQALGLYYQSLFDELLVRKPAISDEYLHDDRSVGQWNFVSASLAARPGPPRLRLLEVGAGDAFPSLHLRHHLPHTEIDVVEPGEQWGPYYDELSIRRVNRLFPFASPDRYDYVHLSHCLEHMPDLERSLAALRETVAEGGFAFVEVPNCTPDYWSEDTFDPDGHIHYFTPASLSRFFERSGFELVRAELVGMTHSERNRYWMARELFPPDVIERARRSVRENVPQKDGEYLRALFVRL
jgi:SAM-dependent methyltransferase